MKKLLLAALALFAMGSAAMAQNVVAQPNFVAPRTVVDLGNGPTEILPITGNGAIFTSFGTGTGTTTGSSTSLTLTASAAANPPCVGCFITGGGIANNTTTVSAFNGTTGITLSAVATVATSTTLSWGAACPVSTQANPVQPTQAMALIQAGVEPFVRGLPMYTEGRVCAYGATGPGMQFVNFAIGAH